MTTSLKVASHRVAIVTGAARGIGRSIALRLGRDGHDVAVADTRGSAVYEVEREIRALGRRSMALYTDVSKEEEVEKLVDDVATKLGGVDIVRLSPRSGSARLTATQMVANAGIWSAGTVLDSAFRAFHWHVPD